MLLESVSVVPLSVTSPPTILPVSPEQEDGTVNFTSWEDSVTDRLFVTVTVNAQ